MTSLLITLIALAVLALLAGASTWYAGDAFTRGQSVVDGATLINTGEQLKAAYRLYYSEHATLALSPSGLPPAPYLNSEPEGWTGDCGDSVCLVEKDLPPEAQDTCADLNRKAGLSDLSSASASDLLSAPYFCSPLSTGDGPPTGYRATFVLQR